VWNFAGAKSLVIVTANVPAAEGQRVDIEILDGSDQGNVYLSKKVCPLPTLDAEPCREVTGYQRGKSVRDYHA
jgi:hypothetical protein